MGDMADDFRALDKIRKERRQRLGVQCPGCKCNHPKRIPTILLPGQKCRWCGYRDTRKREDE